MSEAVVRIGAPPRWRVLVAALMAALIALTAMAAAPDAEANKKGVAVKVMTRNLFLGADLSPALEATTFEEFTTANGNILEEVDLTNFPLRAQGLAAEIESKRPNLIGLQEVAWWRTNPNPGPPAQGEGATFTATETRYDFLQLLLDQLSARGMDYEVVVAKTEFDFEAPTDTDNDPNTGLFGGDIQGRLTMRDVILVNRDSRVKATVKNPQSASYSNIHTPNIAGIDVPVTRGWAATDVAVRKGKGENKVKEKFRFVNTHFEAFDDETQVPSIRARQAMEVLAGPASAQRTIMLGDFNSDSPGVQPGDEQAFDAILAAGFTRRATSDPLSCCVSNMFTSPATEFDHQVDHIVTNMSEQEAKLVTSSVTGLDQVNGIYDSDHAGVFSRIRLK